MKRIFKKEINFLSRLVILSSFTAFLVLFSSLSLAFASAGELRVTEEHPFLVDGEWISASELKLGDELTTLEGKKVRITSLEDVVDEPFLVYNLEANHYSNFVVRSVDGLGVIVHNSNNLLGIKYKIKPQTIISKVSTKGHSYAEELTPSFIREGYAYRSVTPDIYESNLKIGFVEGKGGVDANWAKKPLEHYAFTHQFNRGKSIKEAYVFEVPNTLVQAGMTGPAQYFWVLKGRVPIKEVTRVFRVTKETVDVARYQITYGEVYFK